MTEQTRRLTERDLAAAWNDGLLLGSYPLPDGGTVDIVHRGAWTHGFGPDFRDAMITIDGRALLTGSIEIHLVASGWRAHGHHLDSRYNDVIAHVVLRDDGSETRRLDGKIVPVLEIAPDRAATIPLRTAVDWSLVGGDVCAESFTRSRPDLIRSALFRLGDVRLAAKSARMEARLSRHAPADVLYQEIWDGLGFTANREPMRSLAERMPLAAVESLLATVAFEERLAVCRGLLFGVAGFLPISPADAHAGGWSPQDAVAAEAAWRRFGDAWTELVMSPSAWTRARVRPANHPALRLSAAASMLARAGEGLAAVLLEAIRRRDNLVETLRSLGDTGGARPIGSDRATGIVANAVIPFAFALAESTGDLELGEAASTAWESLPPAEPNEITRRALRQVAGDARITGLGARGQQGLIHLDQTLCHPRRCFECPIAAAVLEERS